MDRERIRERLSFPVKGLMSMASHLWVLGRLRKSAAELYTQRREIVRQWTDKLMPRFLKSETVETVKPSVMDKVFSRKTDLTPLPKGGAMAEKKKGWPWFKIILIVGVLIALAIFILDRILPKPYEDDDLDDAWADEDDDFGDDEFAEERPPAADAAYDFNEEDEADEKEDK